MSGPAPDRQSAPATDPLELIDARIADTTAWLRENAPYCFADQNHLDDGTPERAYWHYGYLVALKDVRKLLRRSS